MGNVYRVWTKMGSPRIKKEYDFIYERMSPFLALNPYHENMEKLSKDERSEVEIYRAPILQKELIAINITAKFKKKNDRFPDVLADDTFHIIVSEKAKKVIEEHDDFPHQYQEITIRDKAGNDLTDMPYYRLAVRRVIEIPESSEVDICGINFSPLGRERKFISTYQNSLLVKEYLMSLPIFKVFDVDGYVYINEELLHAFRAAGVDGVKEYSTMGGQYWQGVASCG